MGDLPFILQRIPIVHLFYQIKYAIELPKEAGIWVLLEFLGIGVAIISGIVMEKQDMPGHRRLEVHRSKCGWYKLGKRSGRVRQTLAEQFQIVWNRCVGACSCAPYV